MKKNIGIRQRLLHLTAMRELFNNQQSLIKDRSFVDVVNATKLFNEALQKNDLTLHHTLNLLEKKHLAAINFKKQFGVDWLF